MHAFQASADGPQWLPVPTKLIFKHNYIGGACGTCKYNIIFTKDYHPVRHCSVAQIMYKAYQN